MEAAAVPQPKAPLPKRVASIVWANILWVGLAAWALYYLVQDPSQTLGDFKTGLANGTIWALIALGYTLVYGIIELINFAHGEVFMIGSFVAVSLWTWLGVDGKSGTVVIIASILGVLVASMFVSGR